MPPAAKAWMNAAENPAAMVVENQELRRLNRELHGRLKAEVDPRGDGGSSRIRELEGQILRLLADIKLIAQERDHWKANHDNQVKIKQSISQRSDLGDRAAKVAELIAEATRLRDRVAELERDPRLSVDWIRGIANVCKEAAERQRRERDAMPQDDSRKSIVDRAMSLGHEDAYATLFVEFDGWAAKFDRHAADEITEEKQ